MSVRELSDTTFSDAVLKAPGLVLVEFWATWCAPCKMLSPVLDRFAEDCIDRITVTKVDIDQCPETAGEYSVKSAPTLAMFCDGKRLEVRRGMMSRGQLVKWLEATESRAA